MRVSHADRAAVQAALQRAHDAGQLDLTEFDERVQAVMAARTRGDLARTTADLPELPPAPRPPRKGQVFSDTGGGTAMRVLFLIWASATVVNVVVWGILALSGVDAYPWFIWLAPPGAALAVLYAGGVGKPRRRL
jgi:hypothetical protein